MAYLTLLLLDQSLMSAFTSNKRSAKTNKKKPLDDLESVLESGEIHASAPTHRSERSRAKRHQRELRRTCKLVGVYYLYILFLI